MDLSDTLAERVCFFLGKSHLMPQRRPRARPWDGEVGWQNARVLGHFHKATIRGLGTALSTLGAQDQQLTIGAHQDLVAFHILETLLQEGLVALPTHPEVQPHAREQVLRHLRRAIRSCCRREESWRARTKGAQC